MPIAHSAKATAVKQLHVQWPGRLANIWMDRQRDRATDKQAGRQTEQLLIAPKMSAGTGHRHTNKLTDTIADVPSQGRPSALAGYTNSCRQPSG